jgi:hypothetical protein
LRGRCTLSFSVAHANTFVTQTELPAPEEESDTTKIGAGLFTNKQ